MPKNIRNNPSKYILRTMYFGKTVWELTSAEITARNTIPSTGLRLPCCIPMIRVSLNDAFLARYIHVTHGYTHNQCQVTAVDIMGCMTPNLDLGVFKNKIWNKIFHETSIVLKIRHFTPMIISCQIGENIGMVCSQYSPLVIVTLWVAFGAKSHNESWCQTQWYG